MAELAEYTHQMKVQRNKACEFGRLIQSLAVARNDLMLASALAKSRRDPRVASAIDGLLQTGGGLGDMIVRGAIQPGTSANSTWAGPLAPLVPISEAFVEYLYPLTIIGRLDGLRTVPFQARFGRTTAGVGAAADFVGPNEPIPVAAMSLDTLQLAYARLAVILVITADLARFSSPDAQATIVDDAARAVQQGLDRAFLDPNRSEQTGSDGLISPASITHGATQIASTGSTPATLTADAQHAMRALDLARVPIPECVWVMDQRVAIKIAGLRTTTGAAAFEGFQLSGGTWLGLPVLVSAALNDLAGNSPAEGLIALLHPASIAVADDKICDVSLTTEAAVQMDSAPSGGPQQQVSLWQNNLAGVRITRYINWVRRREGCVACITGITI